MSLPSVRVRLPDGRRVDLMPEDIIGRMARADLRLNDPRVSEAHAMVSLRGRQLRLLALAGEIACDREPGRRVVLVPGARIALAPGLVLEIEEVNLPETWLTLQLPRQDPEPLLHSVYSVVDGPPRRLVPGHDPQALAWIWRSGEAWFTRTPDAEPLALHPGPVEIAGQLGELAVEAAEGVASTVFGSTAPRRFVLRYDTVDIEQSGRVRGTISGLPARLFCELAQMSGPVEWRMLADLVWDDPDRDYVRKRFDRTIEKLRDRLTLLGIERDLVRSTGTAMWQVMLREGDEIVER